MAESAGSAKLASANRAATKPLRLDAFVLDQAVLEVRYHVAYLIWDRSGQVWHQIAKSEEELRSLETQPSSTTFAVGHDFQLSMTIDTSRAFAYFPDRNLNAFAAKCGMFFDIVFETLEINMLSRVGLRLIYTREYPRIEDAANSLIDFGLAVIPQGRQFGIDVETPRLEYALRSEDKELGFHVRMRTNTHTTEITPPLGLKEFQHHRSIRHQIVFDIDHYTTAPLRRGQFKPGEWIKDRLHATSRDSRFFLGG